MKTSEIIKAMETGTRTPITGNTAWLQCGDLIEARGFDTVDGVGNRANGDGITNMAHVIVCGDNKGGLHGDFIEVWNNADMKRAKNVRLRPTVGFLKGKYALPIKTIEKIDGVKIEGVNASSITKLRITCKTEEALSVVMEIALRYAKAYNKAWNEKPKTTAKKTEKKDVEKVS